LWRRHRQPLAPPLTIATSRQREVIASTEQRLVE
jgi:hypothetical protein